MLARTFRARSALRGLSFYRAYSAPATSVNQVPANDPVKRDPKPNVSETNATALSSEGSFDKVLQESVAKGEELRTRQAPNYEGTWSTSQQPRAVAMQGPRFEQTIMEDQVRGIRHTRVSLYSFSVGDRGIGGNGAQLGYMQYIYI